MAVVERWSTQPTATHAWCPIVMLVASFKRGSASHRIGHEAREAMSAPPASIGTGAGLSTSSTAGRGPCVTVSPEALRRVEIFFAAKKVALEAAVGERQRETEYWALLVDGAFLASSLTRYTRRSAGRASGFGARASRGRKQGHGPVRQTQSSRLRPAAVPKANWTNKKTITPHMTTIAAAVMPR